MSEGRSLRKRPAKPKTPLKKAGTMQKTAKEGKAFLKRGKKGKPMSSLTDDQSPRMGISIPGMSKDNPLYI